VADPDAKLVELYDVKTPLVDYSKRVTFVIGKDRKILKIESGDDAIDPDGAIQACGL
jgi:thioredoxin-dependent peroxiredoxin